MDTVRAFFNRRVATEPFRFGNETVMNYVAEDKRFTGRWRRVTRGIDSCQKCKELEAKGYTFDPLVAMPAHPHCGCVPEPEMAKEPPPEERRVRRFEDVAGMSEESYEQAGFFTPDQYDAHSEYISDGYEDMNRYLRGLFDELPTRPAYLEELLNSVDSLKSAFPSAGKVSEADDVLYRGIRGDAYNGQVGDVITEQAFMSTSAYSGTTGFGQAIKFNVPAGQEYLIGNLSEREIILPPGAKFRIDALVPGTSYPAEVTILP
jgi:hypothetical protein